MSKMDHSEVDEATNGFKEPSLRRKMDNYNASKSQPGPISSPPELRPDRISTPGEQLLPKGKILNNLDAISNQGNTGSWFWADDEHIFLNSTPFTFNVPVFRHNPIRLAKADLVNAGSIDVLDWKLLSSPDETLDWTAFQIAILGGA
jgi:hypothetical protein